MELSASGIKHTERQPRVHCSIGCGNKFKDTHEMERDKMIQLLDHMLVVSDIEKRLHKQKTHL